MILISKVPVKIYVQGTESNRDAFMITVVFNISSDTGKGSLAVGNLACDRRRLETGRKNGYPPDVSDDRFFSYDTDYHTESAYRWSGTTSQAVE